MFLSSFLSGWLAHLAEGGDDHAGSRAVKDVNGRRAEPRLELVYGQRDVLSVGLQAKEAQINRSSPFMQERVW